MIVMFSGLSVQNPNRTRGIPGGDMVRDLLRRAAEYVQSSLCFCSDLISLSEVAARRRHRRRHLMFSAVVAIRLAVKMWPALWCLILLLVRVQHLYSCI